MNRDCSDFRRLLEAALEGSAAQEGSATCELARLGWHEHLLTCDACREVLAAEEALDGLLASLPEPKLPAPLVRRVLRRLRVTFSDARLDDLLGLDPQPVVPEDLAARVLANVSSARAGSDLDALLERDDRIDVPATLPARVLAHVHKEQALLEEQAPRATFRLRSVPVRGRAAAAVLLVSLATFGAWRLQQGSRDAELAQAPGGPGGPEGPGASDGPDGPDQGSASEPPSELLDALAVLENWDLLTQIDPVSLDAITIFGPEDELFRELSEDG